MRNPYTILVSRRFSFFFFFLFLRRFSKAYRREGLDWLLLDVIPREIELGVVDSTSVKMSADEWSTRIRRRFYVQTALSTVRPSQQGLDRRRRDLVVGAVRRVLEEEVGNPVVGEVLGHVAGGAGCPLADIALHGGVEGIAAHNHVQMGRRQGAGLRSGIQALDRQGRAGKPEPGLGRRDERAGDGQLGAEGLHLVRRCRCVC
jgi:hypothetical protein